MIHLNIGSNLNSKFGNRFDNITIAIDLLLSAKVKIKKISNFYKTPSYPNKKFPDYLNVGVLCSCLLYTSPSPRDPKTSRMPSSA